jgi:hypothetical protein
MSENKTTVERYMDGFNTSDHALILSCLTDDIGRRRRRGRLGPVEKSDGGFVNAVFCVRRNHSCLRRRDDAQ